MPTIYDYLDPRRPRVSSERIHPRNQAGLELEREVAAMGVLPPERLEGRPDLQEAAEPYRRSIHAAAVSDRDPLARSNYRAKTAQAAMAPAFGAEYGQAAQGRADIASQHLYGSPAPKPGPVDKYLHGAGQMAREQEDYASGAFQDRMDQGDGGLAGLAAPVGRTEPPPELPPEPEFPEITDPDPTPSGEVAVAAGGMMGAVQPSRQRGWARPTESQMKQAERSQEIRRTQAAKRDEARQKQRNFKLQQQKEQREALGGLDPRMVDQLSRTRWGSKILENLMGRRNSAHSPEAIKARQDLQDARLRGDLTKIERKGQVDAALVQQKAKLHSDYGKLMAQAKLKIAEYQEKNRNKRATEGQKRTLASSLLTARSRMQDDLRKAPSGFWSAPEKDKIRQQIAALDATLKSLGIDLGG